MALKSRKPILNRKYYDLRYDFKKIGKNKNAAYLRQQIGRSAVKMLVYDELLSAMDGQIHALSPSLRDALTVIGKHLGRGNLYETKAADA